MISSVFNWSSGKDSSLALYHILKANKYSVQKLVTNVNKTYGRVSMHGLREEFVEQQAKSIGIPLHSTYLKGEVSMDTYAETIREEVAGLIKTGIQTSIYGDIFLEDLKSYRGELHQDLNIDLHYPLWKHDTRELIEEFIGLGFKAIPICINASKLDLSFLGREIDMDFLNDLPKHIDPCGENGEFHTFVYDGPIFSSPIPYKKGTVVKKDYSTSQDDSKRWDSTFWYLDLLPK